MAEKGERTKKQPRIEADTLDIQERVVHLNRVAKVVKGGRTFRFSALVVVGDGNGHVGCGMGKAAEIPDAIRKGIDDAKKNMITFLKGNISSDVLYNDPIVTHNQTLSITNLNFLLMTWFLVSLKEN